jgi:hypothetical protein
MACRWKWIHKLRSISKLTRGRFSCIRSSPEVPRDEIFWRHAKGLAPHQFTLSNCVSGEVARGTVEDQGDDAAEDRCDAGEKYEGKDKAESGSGDGVGARKFTGDDGSEEGEKGDANITGHMEFATPGGYREGDDDAKANDYQQHLNQGQGSG